MNVSYIVTRDEDGTYCATVPALPGCFADGRTLTELRDNVREAVQAVLESYAMLPPGADPLATPSSGSAGIERTVSIRFERPARRRGARRREAAHF